LQGGQVTLLRSVSFDSIGYRTIRDKELLFTPLKLIGQWREALDFTPAIKEIYNQWKIRGKER